jgi:energy-coupling factor transporter ATP-binding protein EcfA2
MDPITPGVISGLVTNALGGAAGSIPRVLRSRRNREVTAAVGDLNASAQSFLLPALANLADRKDGAQETVGRFLGTVEAETYVRSVTCAALSGKLGDLRSELHDQLIALLVLVANARRETAHDLAGMLLGLFTRTIDMASRKLDQADRALFVSVGDRARAEHQAGSLDGLVQRNRLLQRRAPTELADFLDFADQYRTLLHDRTSELVPAYFDVQRRVPINRLYVQPRFSHEREAESLDALLARTFRTVILGDPGAGKSTLAQHLAHVYSAPRTGEFGVVPFVVTLRTYEEWKKSEHGSVIAYIAAHIVENFQVTVPDGAVEYLLLTGRAFVLFDGLDELINIATRREICDVIANFADLYASATVLVTSRKIGYFEAPINTTRFNTTTLLSFTDDDVEAYVANWFAVDQRLDIRTREAIVRSFLDESESVRDIRANALMLGLMCNLYRGVRAIPQNRADLYEKCAAMLFEQWDAGRGITTSHVLKADAKSALQDVALWMYTTPELSDGVMEKQLVHRLTDFWSKRFEDRQRAMDVAKELVSLWKGRTWVLTDVGTTGDQPGLVYKFTHQTFLEYFAAVELVRRNPSTAALWEQLQQPLTEGGWEIVAQLAIQKLDEFCLDGADAILDLLVTKAETSTEIRARTNLLSFASRNLDSLYARPATQRRLVTAAMDLALVTLPSTGTSTNSREYVDLVVRTVAGADHVRRSDPRDLWQPVLALLEYPGERRELVIDQLLRHSCGLIGHGGTETAAAFVFLMLRDSFERLARIPSDSFDEELVVTVPVELWNVQQIECRLGQPLSSDQILRWSRTNFWAAVLAYRTHVITVADLVRSAGVAMLACSADPFFGMGVSIKEGSPLEELLLAYLDCVGPYDRCQISADEARRTLAVVGRELDRELPKFDMEWLSATVLYDRVVRRNFLSGDGDEPVGPSPPVESRNEDAMFGAAVLLAVVIETEGWSLVDYSEDQLGSLALGPLQVLEPVFVARRTEGFWGMEIDDALATSGLSAARRKVLASWATRRANFTL